MQLPLDSTSIILYLLLAVTLLLLAGVIILFFKLKRLMRGKNAASLEDTIIELENEIKRLKKFRRETLNSLEIFNNRIAKSIKSAGHINYKAFSGMDSGGSNSFSTALVDEHGDGVVLSTLHARNRINVYAKPIMNWQPELELTKEELETLQKVKDSCSI